MFTVLGAVHGLGHPLGGLGTCPVDKRELLCIEALPLAFKMSSLWIFVSLPPGAAS